MARRARGPGEAVGCDLDLLLINVRTQGLQLRQGNIVAGPIEPASFDLVPARALLHHVADSEVAIVNLVASLRPGGDRADRAGFLTDHYRGAARSASVLGRLARMVAGTRDRL